MGGKERKKKNLRQEPEYIFQFVFCDVLSLKFDLKTSEIQGIQIWVQTSYLDPFQPKQERTKSSAV